MTPYEKYIKELERLKQKAEDTFIAHIGDISDLATESLMQWIDNTLEIKGGELVAGKQTIELLNNFSSIYLESLGSINPYKGAVVEFIKNLSHTADIIKDYQKSTYGFDLTKAKIPEIQKLVVDNIIDSYTENGLNANFVQPVRDLLYQNITSGTRVQDAKKFLKEYIKGGNDKSGKLDRYLTQTAQQAVDGYTGAINKKLMDTFDFNAMIISGSLIKTSSRQCRYAINDLHGIIKKENWEDLKTIALENGLIDGTTFQNLPANKLHHGCRHEFTPAIINDGDRIGTNEIFSGDKPVKTSEFDKPGNLKKQTPKEKVLYSDPLALNAWKEFAEIAGKKIKNEIRRNAFNKMINVHPHDVKFTDKKTSAKVITLQGSRFSPKELHIAESLSKEGYHIVFPNKGVIEKSGGQQKKNNDVYMIDTKTFHVQKTELKQLDGFSSESIAKQIKKEQAPVIAYNIQSNISSRSLIKGIREGWTDQTQKIMVKWKGQWFEMDKNKVFNKWILENIR